MSEPAITVERLCKRYRMSDPSAPAGGGMRRLAARVRRGLTLRRDDQREWFWAVRDVSFTVQPGAVVGLIGLNGAGKSTLLKMLSRITDPTSGFARVRGRVGSLLEVGTGFHPELSGRDNIYLNGAILGMTRAEIRSHFDEIVAFAEVERFIDTPVKRYSSGMYVRLAFAVAAHLESEILFVDEVLAVGDSRFQRKCLGKMGDVSRAGRTILFVSHNLAAVEHLCRRGIVLERGCTSFDGDARAALAHYARSLEAEQAVSLADRADRDGTGAIRFLSAALRDAEGQRAPHFCTGREAALELTFENRSSAALRNLHLAIGIDNHLGQRVAHLSTEIAGQSFDRAPERAGAFSVKLPRMPLLPGRYHYTIYLEANGIVVDWVRNAGTFDVEPGDFYATGKLPADGVFCMDCRFDLRGASKSEPDSRRAPAAPFEAESPCLTEAAR